MNLWPNAQAGRWLRTLFLGAPYPKGTVVITIELTTGDTITREARYIGRRGSTWQYQLDFDLDPALVVAATMPVLPGSTEIGIALKGEGV